MIREDDLQLSEKIEDLLVARNLRGMQSVQMALAAGYYLRGASLIYQNHQRVLIGTGFPVAGSFETDGPVGAIALYEALEALGGEPVLACAPPLLDALASKYRTQALSLPSAEAPADHRALEAQNILDSMNPTAIISIERPGLSASGKYYNMRHEDISASCACFDECVQRADCPSIAIGDGGNEIGMGNVRDTIAKLDIEASTTHCDELLVADVSNWGAYGIIAFLGRWSERDLLASVDPVKSLAFLCSHGGVDGVTREATLSEDGLPASEGLNLIDELRRLCK
ncbi:MAG: glutamate cyclase domain-containing protein [Pseudomonadota bacterium]